METFSRQKGCHSTGELMRPEVPSKFCTSALLTVFTFSRIVLSRLVTASLHLMARGYLASEYSIDEYGVFDGKHRKERTSARR